MTRPRPIPRLSRSVAVRKTMNTVDGILNRTLRAEAEKRGYIVVAPAAPDGDLFFERGARIFPDFLKMILADYEIQDGKFHIAGGIQWRHRVDAHRLATAYPQYFLSATAIPWIFVGADAGEAASNLETVRLHVCRRRK